MPPPLASPAPLTQQLLQVRERSLAVAEPLSAEDQQVQSMPDASPTKWHLAHSTWFFEALLLQPLVPGYRPHDPRYAVLFNSYYERLGQRVARAQRGLISRPSLQAVKAYRRAVDSALVTALEQAGGDLPGGFAALLRLGLQHEEQHQELMLTDALHALSCNPLRPAYRAAPTRAAAPLRRAAPAGWLAVPAGAWQVGENGGLDGIDDAFAFDNEGPAHTVHLGAFRLARRPVTNGEFQAFIDDGGYRTASLWLSDGWTQVQAEGWQAPLYWEVGTGNAFGLHGVVPLDPQAAVTHLSFYEACAFAEWAGARLPTEFEWEVAARLHGSDDDLQFFGTVWQWTRSAYAPYPGYRPWSGAVGEYNGKFMVGQQVLRGSSSATPPGHSRPSYRNFFPPAARWQFSGLRLAQDL